MKDVHVNMAKVSNSRVKVCRNNSCEQKPQVCYHCEHSISNSFFYSGYSMRSHYAGFLHKVFCSRHTTATAT